MVVSKNKSKIEKLREHLKADIETLFSYAESLEDLDLDAEELDYDDVDEYASQVKDLAEEILKNLQEIEKLS